MPIHCSSCNVSLRVGLGCAACKDFQVCALCYGRTEHQHDMKQVILLLSTDLFAKVNDTNGNASQVQERPANCFVRTICQSAQMQQNHSQGICKLIFDHFSASNQVCNCAFCKKMFLVYKLHCVKCQLPLCKLENCKIINEQLFKRHLSLSANEDTIMQKLMKNCVVMRRAQNPPARTNNESTARNPALLRKFTIQRCIRTLVHASNCTESNCMPASCQKMKRILTHVRVCKRKVNGGCIVCKQLCTLCCYHAKTCTESKCTVLLCALIKRKLKDGKFKKRAAV